MLRIKELKALINHGTLETLLSSQMKKLKHILERDAPPNCSNLHNYSLHLREYTYLCRKLRQMHRISNKLNKL